MRSLRLLLLTAALPLGGCFTYTGDPLWPPQSGEQLPYSTGTYECTEWNTSSNTRKFTYEVKQVTDGTDLYYTFNEGHTQSTASFHRINGNDYVMVFRDKDLVISYMYLQLRNSEARFVLQDKDVAKQIAKNFGVSTDGLKLASVDSDAAKKFIVEVGRHLENAELLMTCTHI